MAYYDLTPIRPGHQFRGALTGVLESFTEVKRMRKTKFLAGVLTAAMLMSTLPMSAFAAEPIQEDQADGKLSSSTATEHFYADGVKLSKTAQKTGNGKYDPAEVTLTVAGNNNVQEAPVIVEFVVDATSSLFSGAGYDTDLLLAQSYASAMVNALEGTNAKVGVTMFANEARDVVKIGEVALSGDSNLDAAELTNSLLTPELYRWGVNNTGTNVEAGIRMGKSKLDAYETNARKYLVLITDGGSFWWNDDNGNKLNSYLYEDDKIVAYAQNIVASERALHNSGDGTETSITDLVDKLKFDSNALKPNAVATAEAAQKENWLSVLIDDAKKVSDFEKGVYAATLAVDDVAKSDTINLITVGYPYYSEDSRLSSLTNLADSFINYAGSKGKLIKANKANDVSDKISSELKPALTTKSVIIAENSVITDFIGKGKENVANTNRPYDFDVDTAKEVTMTFNNIEMKGTLTNNNDGTKGFVFKSGEDIYGELTYGNETNNDNAEYFELKITKPVTISDTVTLKYTVNLADYSTATGDHSLNVNNQATLEHETSAGATHIKLFPVPKYKYSNSGSSGGGGGKDPGSTDVLEKDDHYAYVVGYPEDYRTGEPTEDMTRWPVKPQNNITREEVATIFFRLLKDDFRAECWSTDNSFPDVASDRWSNNAVSTAETAGIISGYPDGTFRPGNKITRAEFATIAAQFDSTEYTGADKFTDISGHWASDYINRAAVRGWISGYPDGTFKPNQYITRAEAMTLINAVLDRKPDKDHLHADMIVWPDNPSTAWYYAQVQEATNSHDYEERTSYSEIEIWTKIIPSRDWDSLEDPNNSEYLDSNAGEVVKK